MKITREQALAVMRYSVQHEDYKFPLTLMNFEYGKDNGCDECKGECKCFTGIDLVDDRETLRDDKEYKTFEVRGDGSETEKDVRRIRKEEIVKFAVYPAYACQECGCTDKRVQTLIDDKFCYNQEQGGFEAQGFCDDFSHTGIETCVDCQKDWTGA